MDETDQFRADNLAAILPIVDQLSDIDTPICSTSDGSKVSLLWAAANFDAENIACFLVRKGANPLTDHGSGASNAVAAGTGGFRALRGMVRGGFSPDAITMLGLWKANFETDIPLFGLGLLGHQLSNDLKIAQTGELEIAQRLIIKSKPFQDFFATLVTARGAERSMAVLRKKTGLAAGNSPIAAEMENLLDTAALVLSLMLSYGLPFVVSEPSLINRVVREEFYGYRKEKKFLNAATKRAVARLGEHIGPRVGAFTDDDTIQEIARFILSKLPIRAMIEGLQVSGAVHFRNDGRAFEAICSESLQAAGFLVRRSAGTGDQGADLIANKESRSFVIQCKCTEGIVGNSAVQEAIAARAFYGSDYAVVCVTSSFTKSARSLAANGDVLLIGYDAIAKIDTLVRIFD